MSTTNRSQEIFDLYEKMAGRGRIAEDASTDKSLNDLYASSQWTLMWRKFVRNKAAIGGGTVIVLLYLMAAFAAFLSPYSLTSRFSKYIYMPPQPIHWFDNGKLQPFVYDVKLDIDINLRKTYTPNLEKKIPLQFFAHGDPYKLLGFIPSDIHLFSVPEGIVSSTGH